MIPRERPAGQALDWSRTDRTEMKPGVAERKWEVDSLCYVLRLAHDYWEFTGDTEPFDGTWAAAAKTIVATFRQQQRTSGPGPYRFQRRSDQPTETTLAGIGMVESHHGTYRGATIAPNGDVSPPIRGVHLDGTNGNLEIIDNEQSTDGDPVYVRAMGPMQFIPETWRLYGVDANNDGKISPDNIDDAALSAAGYLCFRGKDLATPRGWMNALHAYNHSDQYARTVRDWATAYAQGHPL